MQVEEPVQCSHCHKRYSRASSLARHIAAVHLKLKPYKCYYCNKEYTQSGHRLVHMRLVHDHHVTKWQLDNQLHGPESNIGYFLIFCYSGQGWFYKQLFKVLEITLPIFGYFSFCIQFLQCVIINFFRAAKGCSFNQLLNTYFLFHLHDYFQNFGTDSIPNIDFSIIFATLQNRLIDHLSVLPQILDVLNDKIKTSGSTQLPSQLGNVSMSGGQCPYCNRYFKQIKIHIQTVHFKLKPYRCQFCNQTFGRSGNRLMHMRNRHPVLFDQTKAEIFFRIERQERANL